MAENAVMMLIFLSRNCYNVTFRHGRLRLTLQKKFFFNLRDANSGKSLSIFMWIL